MQFVKIVLRLVAIVVVIPVEVACSAVSGAYPITSIQNSVVTVEYRMAVTTDFAPEIFVFVRNRTDRSIGASLDWTARICGDEAASIGHRGRLFLAQLFRGGGQIRLDTKPEGWMVAIVPLGLPVEDGDPTYEKTGCYSHFKVKTSEGEPIEWKVPLLPAIIDKEFRGPH